MSRKFSATVAIASQQELMANNREHFAAQEVRALGGDVKGYWRAELEYRKDVTPISRQAEVAMIALRQLVEHLEASQ